MTKKRIKLVGSGWNNYIATVPSKSFYQGLILEVDLFQNCFSWNGVLYTIDKSEFKIEILPDEPEQEDPHKEPREVESLKNKNKCKLVEFAISPCPFCGHEADLKISDSGGIQVGCTNEDCGCTLPSWLPFSKDDDSTVFEKIELAIKHWNKRLRS